jgi:hypothetical protein
VRAEVVLPRREFPPNGVVCVVVVRDPNLPAASAARLGQQR